MSETLNTQPLQGPELIKENVYSNGARHVEKYAVDGSKQKYTQADAVNEYGVEDYDQVSELLNSPTVTPQEQTKSNDNEATPLDRWQKKEAKGIAAAEKVVEDAEAAATKARDGLVEEKNKVKNAVELERSRAEGAQWNSRVKVYVARDEVVKKLETDPNYNPTKKELEALQNGDLQERLDIDAGKDPITKDDINYFNLLKKQAAERRIEELSNNPVENPEAPSTSEPNVTDDTQATKSPFAAPEPGTMFAEGDENGAQKLATNPVLSSHRPDVPAPGANNGLNLDPEVAQNLDDIIKKARKAKAEGNYQDYLAAMAEFDQTTEGMDPEVANKVASMGDQALENEEDGRIPRVSHEEQEKRVKTKEIQKAFAEVSDRYAQETAKARHGYLGRFAQGNTWLGKAVRKIPGVSSLVEKINGKFNKDLQSAKADYDSYVNMIGAHVGSELASQGLSPQEIRAISNAGNIMTERTFEESVINYRNEKTKDTNPLVNWWTNSKSKKGKVAKFALAAGVGLATGLVTGGVAPAFGFGAAKGSMIGAGLGGGFLGNYINKRRGKAVLKSDNEMITGQTLIESQAAESLEQKSLAIQDGEMVGDSAENSLFTEARTNLELSDRRSRFRKTFAAAKIGGLASTWINSEMPSITGGDSDAGAEIDGNGDFQNNLNIDNSSDYEAMQAAEDARTARLAEAADQGTDQPDFVGNPEIANGDNPGIGNGPNGAGQGAENAGDISNSFNVEAGNGFTHEIQDLGSELGVELDGDTAYRIYNDAINRFGSDLTTGGEYSMGGNNYGIGSAGMTEWNPGVREFLEQQIRNSQVDTLPTVE